MAMKPDERLKLYNELETKSKNGEQLSHREKMQLSRLRYVINNPDIEKEKAKKRAEQFEKLKVENPEKYQEIIDKRAKQIKKTNSKKTKEEKQAQTARAKQVRLEKGYSEESKKKMSEAARKYFENNPEEYKKRYEKQKETNLNKSVEEKEEINAKRSVAMKNSQKFQIAVRKPDRNKKISEKMTGRKRTRSSIEKQRTKTKGRKMTGARLLKQQQVIQDMFEKYGNRGLKVKKFKVNGITCQGSYEKAYLEMLIESNETLPNVKRTYYETSYGFYHPDFEFEDKLIEIKSEYTFGILVGKYANISGEKKVGVQLSKMIEVGKNKKPVELVLIERNKNIKKIFRIDSSFTDSNYDEIINFSF